MAYPKKEASKSGNEGKGTQYRQNTQFGDNWNKGKKKAKKKSGGSYPKTMP